MKRKKKKFSSLSNCVFICHREENESTQSLMPYSLSVEENADGFGLLDFISKLVKMYTRRREKSGERADSESTKTQKARHEREKRF